MTRRRNRRYVRDLKWSLNENGVTLWERFYVEGRRMALGASRSDRYATLRVQGADFLTAIRMTKKEEDTTWR